MPRDWFQSTCQDLAWNKGKLSSDTMQETECSTLLAEAGHNRRLYGESD